MSGPCIHHRVTEDTEAAVDAPMGMDNAAAAELNLGILTWITPPCLRSSVVKGTSERTGSSALPATDASAGEACSDNESASFI